MSFLILKTGVYHGKTLDLVVFLKYMYERVISGLDLRGQSQEITVRLLKYSVEQWKYNTVYQFGLLLSTGVVFIKFVYSFLLMCFNTKLDKTNVNWWNLIWYVISIVNQGWIKIFRFSNFIHVWLGSHHWRSGLQIYNVPHNNVNYNISWIIITITFMHVRK